METIATTGRVQSRAFAPIAPAPVAAPMHAPAAPLDGMVPGPELPPVAPHHPALPNPVPSLAQLLAIATSAPADQRFLPGSHPSMIRNGHYTNTRAQLAFALAGPYNSVEGDVRIRNGRPVMQHDSDAPHDLTFEQWALLAARAGKHLRIDIKEPRALDPVVAILRRLGIPSDTVTFNVGVASAWKSGVPIERVRHLQLEFPKAWVTLNLPLPLGPGYVLATRLARSLDRTRLGVAVMAGLVHRGDIELLRRSFAVVNAWNLPQLGDLDVHQATAKLRAMGVNGMVDLRGKGDPLGSD